MKPKFQFLSHTRHISRAHESCVASDYQMDRKNISIIADWGILNSENKLTTQL